MKKQKSFDTGLELRFRRLLYHRGLRYRVHNQIVPGTRRKVDLAFLTAKVAVFLDGCFWHGCPQHRSTPVANGQWWAAKLRENSLRDSDTDRRLGEAGWQVVRVWEHDQLETAAAEIESVVRDRAPRRSRRSVLVGDDQVHGLSTYGNAGCRCPECRSANARYQQQLLERYRQQGGRGQHGTDYRYRTGCRCDGCRAAHAAEDRAYRRRRKSSM
jgi:DNA mismatch endonuclease (patch repair protein)